MAIDDVFIIQNESSIFDEILAHRLGLIPLKTDLDSYVLPEKCTCKSDLGCPKCRATLTLDAMAPEDKTLTVYSRDLKSEDPGVAPISDRVPIVKLAPNQRVKIEAYARLGRGEEHAKWKPVNVCAYKNYPTIEIDETRCDLCGECVKICPKDVLEIRGEKLVVVAPYECMSCPDCEEKCPLDPPAIRVKWQENAFLFKIEGTGALPVSKIISTAADILREKVQGLERGIKKA